MKKQEDIKYIGGVKCFSYKEVARQLSIHIQTVSRMVNRDHFFDAIRVGRWKYIPFPSLKRYGQGNNQGSNKSK